MVMVHIRNPLGFLCDRNSSERQGIRERAYMSILRRTQTEEMHKKGSPEAIIGLRRRVGVNRFSIRQGLQQVHFPLPGLQANLTHRSTLAGLLSMGQKCPQI